MEKLPNSSHCFVCGLDNDHGLKLTFYQDEDGSVVVDYTVPDYYQGYPGVVHGVIITTLMDEVIGRVLMTGDTNRFMATAKLTTRYRKPVPTEKPIRIVGRIVDDRGRVAEARAEIIGPDGEVLAEAEGLMVALSEEALRAIDAEALGWRVYPDEEEDA